MSAPNGTGRAEPSDRIGALIAALEDVPDQRTAGIARELLQAMLELQGAALARLFEILATMGEPGRTAIEALAVDGAMQPLLLLHGLHPHPFAERAVRAIERLRREFASRQIRIEVVAIGEASLQLRVRPHGSAHPSAQWRDELEAALLERLPDAEAIDIDWPDPSVQPIRFMPRPERSRAVASAAEGRA